MTVVQNAWESMRIAYQSRYAGMCKKAKGNESNADYHGTMMEMSYVLIEVFGLTSKQVEEIEENGGLTNADLSAYCGHPD